MHRMIGSATGVSVTLWSLFSKPHSGQLLDSSLRKDPKSSGTLEIQNAQNTQGRKRISCRKEGVVKGEVEWVINLALWV